MGWINDLFPRRDPSAVMALVARETKEKKKLIIDDMAVIESSAQEEVLNAFKIPAPMPGVLPKNKMAMDAVPQINAAYAFASMNQIFSEGLQFMGYPYLAELTQRAEYRRPSEILAKEMTRKWIKLSVASEEDKTEKLDQIKDELDRLGAQGAFRKAAELDGYFGRAQIFLDCGTDRFITDELKTPLALHRYKIGKKALKRLTVLEPIWTYPNQYNSDNPLDPTFYRPQSWFVMAKEVHSSRLLTIIGRPMPDILKPAYMFGGLSLSQMAKPYVDNWLRTRQSVSDLIHAFSVFGLKTNMGTQLDAGAAKNLRNRAALFNAHRDNRGLMIIDKDTEDFFNVAAPLGSLDKLQAQAQEQQSSVTGIPLSILLGITPSGLNASNDGEIRTFYQWVEAQQESMLSPSLKQLIDVIQMSLFGEIDPDIQFKWEPLWSLSEVESSTARKTDMETDDIAINAGVITPEESRQRLASEENSPYSGLDLNLSIIPPVDEGEGLMDDLLGLNAPEDKAEPETDKPGLPPIDKEEL